MRKSLLRTGLLCGPLLILSGCYSNGKFHSPTWNDLAWWRKDKTPDTSLAAAPSTGGRPSDEALADKNSPGARASAAPPYEAATASFNQPPNSDPRYANAGASSTNYPNTGYPNIPAAPTGGTSWAAHGDAAAANVAANPYARSGSTGYDTGSRYDARPADHAQTTPYDSTYPGGKYGGSSGGNYGGNYGENSGGRTSGDYASPAQPNANPYYRADGPTSPAATSPPATSRYDQGSYSTPDRYTAPDRYAPSATSGATNEKYTAPNYASPQDGARRYNGEAYRDTTGDRYLTDRQPSDAYQPDGARSNAAASVRADAANSRTADSRSDYARSGSDYRPGDTGYQPTGVPNYATPPADGPSAAAAPYQPGGTSRYEPAGGSSGNTSAAGAAYGTNPYTDSPPADRYQQTPASSREGAARY